MEPFKVAAVLNGVAPLKDGGMSVRFHTQEIPTAEKTVLMEYFQQFGWLLFAPEGTELNVPKEQPKEDKTPSQRLRSTLHILWEQRGSEGDFEAWYRQKMEAIIEQVKEKLNG